MADDKNYPGTAQNIWAGSDMEHGDEANLTFNIDRERRDINVAPEIYELRPDETPFLVIGGQVSQETAQSLEEVWYDDDLASWYTEVAADLEDGGEADNYSYSQGDEIEVDVDDTSPFRKEDIVKNTATGEIFRVTGVANGSDKLKLEAGVGYDDYTDGEHGTEPGGGRDGDSDDPYVAENDYFMRLGNAMEENSLAPEPRATQPSKEFNYVQTFRTPFAGSWDDEEEPKRTNESERQRLRRRKAVEHRLDLERALLFGERREIVSENRRLMGGLFQFLEDEFESRDITSDETEFNSFLKDAFWYGSSEKIMIASPAVLQEIDKFARDRLDTRSQEETYGLSISTYISTHGRLHLLSTQMFENDYEEMAVVLDMENISIMPFAGYNTTLRTNIQENDRLGWKDEYLTQMTLKVRLPKTHRVLDNALGGGSTHYY